MTEAELAEEFWSRVTMCPDHWLWSGPAMLHGWDPRRLSWALNCGYPGFGTVTGACDCTGICVRPTHLQLVKSVRSGRPGREPSLSHEDVEAVERRLAAGATLKEVADLFMVSTMTVSMVKRGEYCLQKEKSDTVP